MNHKNLSNQSLSDNLSPAKQKLLALWLRGKANQSSQQETNPDKIRSRRTEQAVLPLSYAQQRLWFLDQMGTETTYHVPMALRLSAPLNLPALEQALQTIVQRHESLRTIFPSVGGQPRQVVQPDLALPLPILTTAQIEGHFSWSELEQPFDLAQGPLIRTTLHHLADDDHLLLIVMHHIMTDGWSVNILTDELNTLYHAFCAGKPDPLLPLDYQYADFVLWQREWLQGARLKQLQDYWQKQLLDAPELLTLPLGRPRPAVQSYHGTGYQTHLPPHLSQAVHHLANQQGVTLFMMLQSAFTVLLARLSGQNDIVIGTPIASRNRTEWEPLVGMFVNTLALRTQIEDNPTFCELLAQVQQTTLDAYEHQDMPFDLLVDLLQPTRSLSYSPFFQVMFTLQNRQEERCHDHGFVPANLNIAGQGAAFDITLTVQESEQGLHSFWEYSTDIFDVATIKQMAGHFHCLLESLVTEPSQRVHQIRLLTSEEQNQLLYDWNETQVEYPHSQCVHHLFEAQAAHVPQAIALQHGRQELTYEQLNQRANQLAHDLQKQGVGPEVLVGIYVDYSLDAVVGLLAILKAGGVYLPLNPDYPSERLAAILDETKVDLLITQSSLLSKLPSHQANVLLLDHDASLIRRESFANPVSPVQPENLAYVIYTSGSTGKPKGIMIEHRGLVNHCYATVDAYKLTAHDRVLQANALSFDVCMEELFPSWLAGATVVMRPQWPCAVSDLAHFIAQEALSVLNLPVGYWHEWVLQLDDVVVPPSVRLLIVGNDKALQERLDIWRQKVGDGVAWRNTYGCSEATVGTTLYDPTEACQSMSDAVPGGRPIANSQIYLLSPYQQPVPLGVAGEIYIGGLGVGRGYWQQPQLTAERFVPNPFAAGRMYRTGDKGRFLPDGNLEVLGRLDNQVKIRGFRVEPSEVEAVLNQLSQIQQTVVVPREDTSNNTYLVAYVVAQASLDPKILRTFAQDRLPAYMIPSAFVQMASLPLSANGKVDRRALPAPDATSFVSTDYVPPATETETALATIWAQLLGVKQVGRHDNFFDLGGHSLLITQLFYQIEKTFALQLPLQNLFQFPTLTASAEQIVRQLQKASGTEVADEPLSRAEWLAEMELDPVIQPPTPYLFVESSQIQGIFLTGATGFLGAFLLSELLQTTSAPVYCLVRANGREHAINRLQDTLEQYLLWQDSFLERLIPVVGDLAQPRLGLSREAFRELAETVDLIYHNGAWVNFLYPYETLKAANVLGTEEILRLAGLVKTKPVHYISTISVFPPWISLCEEHNPLDIDLFGLDYLKPKYGYPISKWVAEKLLLKARARGFPICIYRPSEISGDSRTGVANMKDAFSREIQSCLQLGIMPERQEYQENLVPIDYASQAIVYLSRRRESLGKIFHITNPSSNSKNALFDYAYQLGYQLQKLPIESWAAALVELARHDPTIAAHPLLKIYMGTWEPSLISKQLNYDCRNTLDGLANTAIKCPPVNAELLQTYFDYFVSQAGFPQPGQLVNSTEEGIRDDQS